ncbi:UBN2 domain-containing protein, partial [Cephalotus follicularis]
DFETIKNYCVRVKEIINQMRVYKKNIKDKRVVEKILISLIEKYDMIQTLSITKLVGSLEKREKRLSRRIEGSLESIF